MDEKDFISTSYTPLLKKSIDYFGMGLIFLKALDHVVEVLLGHPNHDLNIRLQN